MAINSQMTMQRHQVVESAGSFSHLKVGNKTYMVYMLLDAIQDLELVVGEDSRWYR